MTWKRGPMPEDTYDWGGVVPFDQKDWGFVFADFKGDHAILCPSGRRLEAHEVKYFNNNLPLPPRSWFANAHEMESEGQRLE